MSSARTRYVVRRKRCGCLVSSQPAKDQATEIGATRQHPDGATSVVMSLEDAARVPELCSEHRPAVQEKQERLW